MPPRTSEQSQSLSRCADLREGCRSAIFTHMDKQHQEQMTVLSKIEKKMAFQEGIETSRKVESFRPLLRRAVVMWSPAALFLMIVGFREWAKAKGWW